MKKRVELRVNGELCEVWIKPNANLLDVLRDDLGLTGTKKGCGQGECGSCTVLMDRRPVPSCLIPAFKASGKEVITIEGLSQDNILDPLQEAFVENGAMQCGFCTPGMIMSAKGLLLKNANPTEEDVKHALTGNLCRCGTYPKVLKAVLSAVERGKSKGE